jgi:hypothetical protein
MTRPDVGYLINKNKRTWCCVIEEICKSKEYLFSDAQQADFGFAAHCLTMVNKSQTHTAISTI